MSDVHDPIDVGTAVHLIARKRTAVHLIARKREDKPAPMATCHADDEPLISTLEFRGAEFYCVVCERKYGFLGPKPAESTPELEARHEELRQRYDEDRARRAMED